MSIGILVVRERVELKSLQALIFKEIVEAGKLNLYLKTVYLEACEDSYIIFTVSLDFSK